MSYNVDTCKLKVLENLVIPVKAFFTHQRTDLHPRLITDIKTDISELQFCEGYISGRIVDGMFLVDDFDVSGEGSGWDYTEIIIPALEKSKGNLEVVRVWEGGDSIDRLTVNDGVVTEEEIEL